MASRQADVDVSDLSLRRFEIQRSRAARLQNRAWLAQHQLQALAANRVPSMTPLAWCDGLDRDRDPDRDVFSCHIHEARGRCKRTGATKWS